MFPLASSSQRTNGLQSSKTQVTLYTETSIYGMFKHYLSGPVFAALGNHDTSPATCEVIIMFPLASSSQRTNGLQSSKTQVIWGITQEPAFTACSNIISLVLSLLHLEIMTPVLQTSILLIMMRSP
jgi:hypothetical protein